MRGMLWSNNSEGVAALTRMAVFDFPRCEYDVSVYER